MQYRYAKKLENRDQVTVKDGKARYHGYVVGDRLESPAPAREVFVDVQTQENGFMPSVRHTDLE